MTCPVDSMPLYRLFASLPFLLLLLQVCAGTTTKRCATCSVESFEEYKQLRQQQILNDLLRKLELAAKPNVTIDYDNLPPIGRSNPRIKALIEQTIREKKRSRRSLNPSGDYVPSLYETDADATPQLSFVMAERAPWPLEDSLDIAMFNLAPSLRRKYIHKANLHVYLRRPHSLQQLHQAAIRIDVYERFMNGTIGDKIASKFDILHGSKTVYPMVIPLDGMDMQTWLQNRVENLEELAIGIYVEAIFDEQNLAFHPRDRYPDNMFLELELFDMPGRSRRNTPQVCQAGTNETKCCLYDLIIDFEKVGWEFVIAPKRYNAYICNGDCMNQSTMTSYGTVTSKSQSEYFQCCHPKDYTGVTIVYVDNTNQIWVREVPAMVARKCGCT